LPSWSPDAGFASRPMLAPARNSDRAATLLAVAITVPAGTIEGQAIMQIVPALPAVSQKV